MKDWIIKVWGAWGAANITVFTADDIFRTLTNEVLLRLADSYMNVMVSLFQIASLGVAMWYTIRKYKQDQADRKKKK